MFLRVKALSDNLKREDLIRDSINLNELDGWEMVSSASLMKSEFKYEGSKFEILQSYAHAVEILANISNTNGGLNIISMRSVWIPFLFLCRHTIELAIKYALDITKINIPKKEHHISKLWKLFVDRNRELFDENDTKIIQRIDTLISVLCEVDDDGSHMRYATSNDDLLYRVKPFFINPRSISDEIYGMLTVIISIDSSLFI